MQTYILDIRDREITLASDDSTLVRTGSGVDEIAFRFYSAEWLDFDLSAALYVGETLIETALTVTESEDADWLATSTLAVPDEITALEGPLGVTVHGTDEDDNHIITALSIPLEIRHEGDGIGDSPTDSPYMED